MSTVSVNSRSCRVEFDHLSHLSEVVSAVSVDPVKKIFYYLAPFLGAWVSWHQELRLGDPLQTMLLSESAKIDAITKVEQLKEIAGICRKITVYTSDNYICSSYGGTCSLTSPIISIPRGFSETIFDHNPSHNLAEKPAAHWRYTPDEALFFIAKEVVNIKSNKLLTRIVAKVCYVALLFFIYTLSLPILAGGAFIAAAATLHLILERLMKNQLDIDAVAILKEFFHDENRANEAGRSALEKLIEQNKERRESNSLCRLYVSEKGNNLLDLTNPFLTIRLSRLEEHIKST